MVTYREYRAYRAVSDESRAGCGNVQRIVSDEIRGLGVVTYREYSQ